MSLHTVLSAMRSLILDGIQIPESEGERAALYRSRFQPLTEEELEDLVRIPPRKLQVYTNTVFSGQRGTLEMHFPVSLALLSDRLEKRFDPFELVQAIHAAHPWKGYPTSGLLRSFVDYWKDPANPITQELPELPDLAELEYLSLEIARGWNRDDMRRDCLSSETLSTLTIEELLGRPLIVEENVRMLSTDFDVLSLRSRYLSSDVLPTGTTKQRRCFLVGGRNREQYVRWTELAEPLFQLLNARRSEPFPVEELAEAFLSSHGAKSGNPAKGGDEDSETEQECATESSEAEQFQEFIRTLLSLEQSGILTLPA